MRRRPRLELRLKCTSADVLRADGLHFVLRLRSYEHLRQPDLLIPRILVVVRVPEEPADWLTQSEEELALRHCGYWLSLRGLGPTTNTEAVTVVLPRNQV